MSRLVCWFLVLAGSMVSNAFSQTLPDPQRQMTLNGLTVLIDNRNTGPNVTISLRIQSGAAFDLAGKGGTMAIAADLLFPDPTTREFIVDELKGKLETRVSYDSTDIVLSGSTSEFERLVQFIRTAVTGKPFTDDDFKRVKAEHIKAAENAEKSPRDVARQAALDRLYGNFPYARPVGGTVASLARVQVGDIIFARERFLNPNNAVLVVSGGIDTDRVMRTVRQLLGLWRKSETIIKQSFRQPPAPDDRVLLIEAPGSDAEICVATRGLGRSDRDFYASAILSDLITQSMSKSAGRVAKGPITVSYESHILPGSLSISGSASTQNAPELIRSVQDELNSLSKATPTQDEFNQEKSALVARLRAQAATPEGLASLWLDSETFGLPSLQTQMDGILAITPADVSRTAQRVLQNRASAVVAAGNTGDLTKAISADGKLKIQPKETPTVAPIRKSPAKP